MDGKTDTTANDRPARLARIAWFCGFALPLILAFLLLSVKMAHATSSLPGLTPVTFTEGLNSEEEEEAEEEAGEFAEEECEIAEEELEAGEISGAEAAAVCAESREAAGTQVAGSSSSHPGRCPMRSANAHAVEKHARLRVTVGYTSSESTGAAVEIRSGSARIASTHRHLGKSGVLRIVRGLGRKAAHRVVVRFKTPSCPWFQTRSTRVR